MRDVRRVVGALCIVIAMVLGALAGLVYARASVVGVTAPTAGSRGGEPGPITADDWIRMHSASESPIEPAIDSDAPASDAPEAPQGTQDVSVSEGPIPMNSFELARAMKVAASGAETAGTSAGGTITVKTEDPHPETRGHLVGGEIDAGGPYGGADTFEGTDITFTVTAYDPSIIFYRWDFNNDGVFDEPDQTGGGSMGKWTTQTSVTRRLNDNYFGDVVAEGWDGVSTEVLVLRLDNYGHPTDFSGAWGNGGFNFAWRFRALTNMRVVDLGHYHSAYTLFDQGLWRETPPVATRLLGSCTATHVPFSWNWCALTTPVDLVAGEFYRISIRISTWMPAVNTPPNTPQVSFQGFYYCFSPSVLCYPSTFLNTPEIPMIDFRRQEVFVVADAASDSASLEVQNVAPQVFGIESIPSPGLEGTPIQLTAMFNDPGADDTWQVRWTLPDGTTTAWTDVAKMSGGAKVLVFHALGPDLGSLVTDIRAACAYCVRVDAMDYGPLGQNRVPSLSELQSYDVLYVAGFWGPIPDPNGLGNLLADYMDAGGNVIITGTALHSSNTFGIAGRWETDGYIPVPRSATTGVSASMGAIYVPGHPLLDGVSTVTSAHRRTTFGITPGAVRIADWTTGHTMIATNENPKVNNGARAVAFTFNVVQGLTTGDYLQLITNAVRWAVGNPDPVLKTMPFQLDPVTVVIPDDEPTTTTPVDSVGVSVEVRDDDDGKVVVTGTTQLSFEDFESPARCSWSPSVQFWPPGWSAVPTFGWRCQFTTQAGSRGPVIFWNYNDFATSNLYTQSYDLSAYAGVRVEWFNYWLNPGIPGPSDGYVEASVDGGATFPIVLREYHTPVFDYGPEAVETTQLGGYSNVVFRFRYVSNDDFFWSVDLFRVTGLQGFALAGRGSADGAVLIANVAPTVIGGFDSAFSVEGGTLRFEGFEITDPALMEPTEWFAYKWDFGDGSESPWVFKGTLTPPKFDVLIVGSFCAGGTTATCALMDAVANTFRSLDVAGRVDTFNFINVGGVPTSPSLSTMMQYDVIVYGATLALSGDPLAWINARRAIGNTLADYLDLRGGGVITTMWAHDIHPTLATTFSLLGRYIEQDYGAFEQNAIGLLAAGTLGAVLDPQHPVMDGVTAVTSNTAHSARHSLTPGGILLARWTDGNDAVAVKELVNGARSVNLGIRAPTGTGVHWPLLLRNAIAWLAGGIPTPEIEPLTYAYGDNGVYTVDLQVIDDDMGFVWDPATNRPVAVLPGASVSHRMVTVAVDNADPTIVPNSIEAFIATEVCVRVSGQGGNSVTANVYADGVLAASVTTLRESGSPNPETEKCGLMRVDVTAAHTYSTTLTYSQPNGGSNPTWLIFSPWRDPVSVGHGTVSYKFDFTVAGTVTQALPTLKADLLEGGQGAKIDFVAEGFDAGTDDLAFLWVWGTVDGVPYAIPNPANAVYTIHVHHNDLTLRTDGTLAGPQFLGFSEPYFDRVTNTGRSALGTMNFAVRDTAVHAFDLQQRFYYVVLILLDDDNTRGYLSPFANDGVDMEFLVVDLG